MLVRRLACNLLFIFARFAANVNMPKDIEVTPCVTAMHQGYAFAEFDSSEDAEHASSTLPLLPGSIALYLRFRCFNMIKLFGKPTREHGLNMVREFLATVFPARCVSRLRKTRRRKRISWPICSLATLTKMWTRRFAIIVGCN